jgi:electron transfer flavoprotein alpha subunit
MRIVVCVKYVPVLTAMRFDPATRRLARDGVPGEVSSFDLRALGRAVALRAEHGGEIVALTMGPPAARAGLEDCLALGADRAVHVMDPLLAGSDTLATARTLAAALLREEADLILFGRSSTDAETGQVGPEVAELLDLPQVTGARRLDVDPAARTFTAERETDEGFETVEGALPAVVTAAEDIAEERFPKKAEREAAKTKPIVAVGVADLGLAAGKVGEAGSPTWVAGVEQVEVARRGELVAGDSPEALAAALGERIRALVPPRAEPAALPERAGGDGPALWVVCELGPKGLRPVTAELLAKAATLASALGGRVEVVAIGGGREHAAALAAAGADRVLVAESPGLEQYTTDTHAAVLAEAIRVRQPRLVLLGATVRGRDLAPRVAARLGLGLTGDAIELDVDAEGRVRQMKPAFGGAVVAPILSHTRPELATVRPGVLPAARPDSTRRAGIEALAVPVVPSRVRVTATRAMQEAGGVDLDTAEVVIGIGRGVGAAGVASVVELAGRIGAGVAATREVTDAGWLPRQHQVGLTGRAIAPRLYVAVAIGGAAEHLVGIRRAGLVVAINKNAKAPILKAADLGVVADCAALLPHLAAALRLG